jgi:tight adherence protein B
MKLRALVVAAAALAVLAPAGPAWGAMSLSPTGDARFPERAFVVTLPERTRLAPSEVQVTENGQPVHGLRTSPVGAARRARLGVVLALDASSSMKGPAFEGALEAARAFADERNPRQPFALVTFGTGSKVVLPFTTIDDEIDSALDRLGTPKGGTHMYDAALRSIELVRKAKLPGGFVVVMSDGTDHGSAAGSEEVVAAARAARVHLYTVGLQSPAFDPDALSTLAELGGGEYSEATSPDELQEIYRALGAQLSNAHVLTYRSLVRPGRRVEVRATVAGLGTVTTSYRSPRLELDVPSAPSASDDGGGWDSPAARAGIVVVVVGLLGLSLLLVLRPRRRTPRERVTQFVRPADEDAPEPQTLTGRLAAGAERSLSSASSWERFAAALDVAGLRYSPGQVVVRAVIAGLSLALLLSSATGSGPIGVIGFALVPFGLWLFIRRRMRRERRLFGDQLPDHLAVVGGSLRVGHSLTGALTSALDDAPDPVRREFARALTDERLGMPLEDALQNVSVRMENREVEHVALLAKLQRETGADAGEMVDQVVATVRERQELRRLVRTLTAQGRLSQLILSLLPIGSLLFLTVAYGDYVDPLYNTSGGNIVLGIAAVLVICGALAIRKIVSFKV